MPYYTHLISAAQLHALIHQQVDVVLLDARHDLAFPDSGMTAHAKAHIDCAFFVHMDHDLSGEKTGKNGRHPLPDLEELAKKLRSFGLNNTSQVVIYDEHNAMMAARAWWLLRHMGHQAVAVLDGGLAAWSKAGHPLSASVPVPRRKGDFFIKPSLNHTVTAEALMAHLGDGTYHIVDARAPERFSGEIEPIDPVGGHIPHAVNYFFMNNLQEDLTFKSAQNLRKQWLDCFNGYTCSQVVNQCGSGVTACHNLLAQHIAGLAGAALYAGSWSQWCSDTTRPVAKGLV